MSVSWPTSLVSVLFVIALLLSLQVPAEAENVYLYRLKKLRNSFHVQIEDQVASNDVLVEKSYLDTLQQVVDNISRVHQEAIADIKDLLKSFDGLSEECREEVQPQKLFTRADTFLQQCVRDAEKGAETISDYVIKDAKKFQCRSSEFSQWFLSAYLSDWEVIFGEEHYNDVYDELSNQVVEWDNVGSIKLFQFRQDVIKRLASLSTAIDACTIEMTKFISDEYDVMYLSSSLCR